MEHFRGTYSRDSMLSLCKQAWFRVHLIPVKPGLALGQLLDSICISCFSHCCDKIVHKSNLGKKGLFWSQFWGCSSSWQGGHGTRSVRRLVTWQREVNADAQLTFSFIQSETQPIGWMVLPTFRVDLHSSVKPLRKHAQRPPQVCH